MKGFGPSEETQVASAHERIRGEREVAQKREGESWTIDCLSVMLEEDWGSLRESAAAVEDAFSYPAID